MRLLSKNQKSNMRHCLIAVFVGLIFLSGCKQPVKDNHITAHELQARCIDLPFPLDITIKNKGIFSENENHAQFFITYATNLTFAQLKKFYLAEMELLGWHEQALFEQPDSSSGSRLACFVFDRPGKVAVITISTFNKKLLVQCCMGSKNSY